MSAAISSDPLAAPRPGVQRADRGQFRSRELSDTTVLVAAVGEVDAANAADLVSFIEDHVAGYQQLVLDLSQLAFFSADGFSTLHSIRVRCSRRAVEWVLVPGPAVSRVLRVCDPEEELATAGNIVSAVAALARGPHRHLQLTPLP